MQDRLLYPLFDALRKEGAPLGVSEYVEAVAAIREGYALEDPDRLLGFLCLFWAKNSDQKALLETLFLEKTLPILEPKPPDGKGPEPAPEDRSCGQAAEAKIVWLNQVAQKQAGGKSCGSRDIPPEIRETPGFSFRMAPRPPVGYRRAARALLGYRKPMRAGQASELNIPATVARICREKYLVRPVFSPRMINRAELWLLVDRGGSMAPFSPALSPLLDAAVKETRLGRMRILYFHDCPSDGLSVTRNLAMSKPPDKHFSAAGSGAGILIVSDAGAARGDYDGNRARYTRAFFESAGARIPRIAWINPVPPERWAGSTAEAIRSMVPMFPLTRDGLERAVTVLRMG